MSCQSAPALGSLSCWNTALRPKVVIRFCSCAKGRYSYMYVYVSSYIFNYLVYLDARSFGHIMHLTCAYSCAHTSLIPSLFSLW
ncbi:unnamed protein product, partial [Staurois parvus]